MTARKKAKGASSGKGVSHTEASLRAEVASLRQQLARKRHPHLADFLSTSELTPEDAVKVKEELTALWRAIEDGKVRKFNYIHMNSAPAGHPDAFPKGDGVRRDGRTVQAVILEIQVHDPW